MALVVIGGWLAARAHRPREVRFRLLVAIQVTAFIVMELGERVIAGYTAPDLWHALVDHGLWLVLAVGIVAQVVSAWFGSAASRAIAAATTTRSLVLGRSRSLSHVIAPSHEDVVRWSPIGWRGRAPPASTASLGPT